VNLLSVKTRFLFSVGANALRALVSLCTGLLVARGLSPSGYGDLTYLLGSFVAIRALLDLGSSNAFYTFLSRSARSRTFYSIYYGWLLLQFTMSLLLVAVVFPQSVLQEIWLGHSRDLILYALIASFMQQQVWTTITQMGESSRLTVKVQLLGLAVVAAHLAIVIVLKLSDVLSVKSVLGAIIGEYVVALLAATRLMRMPAPAASSPESADIREILAQYWRFCRPLMIVAFTGFLYDFADKWLLQRFAGANQQGFYQIAAQLAAVSLLATTSILNIFWKEIAEASARQDKARLALLYNKVNRGLLVLGAIVSCFLIPWARQLVILLLGEPYRDSWPVLALMLLYPLHQSMGQVNATMFMACERTRDYMIIALIGQLASLPVSYFLLAAPTEIPFPGMGLGAYGLALKMVGMNIVLVNLQAWVIARFNHWKYEWLYQIAAVIPLLLLGYFAKAAADLMIAADSGADPRLHFIVGLVIAGAIFVPCALLLLWLQPGIAGFERAEMRLLAAKLNLSQLARR
jgi:O-antigen/teichoic acid export membrane protein